MGGSKKSDKGKRAFSLLSIVTEAGTLGFTLAICLIVGVLLGRYVDMHFNTSPWGLICLSFLGAVTGFWSLYKKALRYMAEEKKQHDNHKDKGETD